MKKTTTTTELTVKAETKECALTLAASSLFKDIDFNGLNATIDALGEGSKTLTPEEKATAVNVISDWENTVVCRLSRKNQDYMGLIAFFNNTYSYYDNKMDEDKQIQLAIETKTSDLYNAYREFNEALADYSTDNKPETFVVDPDKSYNENDLIKQDNQKEWYIFNQEVGRLTRARDKALKDWKTALRKDENVKLLMKAAKRYQDGFAELTEDCKNKSQLAKLNVAISSADVRTSLRELLNFSSEI